MSNKDEWPRTAPFGCHDCGAEFIAIAGGHGDDDVNFCPFCGSDDIEGPDMLKASPALEQP